MTEIRYDRGRWRKRGSKERGNEERTRTMVWMDQGEEGSEKGPWVGRGKRGRGGSCIDRAALQGFIPSPRPAPTTSALWNEHYTSRWRTVEEYPRYFSFSRSASRFLLRSSSSSSSRSVPFFFVLFPSVFHSVLFSLLSLFPFLRVPLPLYTYAHVKVRFLRFSLSLSLSFLSFYIFFSTVFSPILDSRVCSSDERKGETKNGKRHAIEGGSRGAVTGLERRVFAVEL